MRKQFDRRAFLGAAAALTCTALNRDASGAMIPRIQAPIVDKLVVQVVVDGAHDVFISGAEPPGIKVTQSRLESGPRARRTLQTEWGLSLHLTSTKGSETKRYLLDYAYTSDVLNNNLDLLGIDVSALDALILSHGHLDHWGGLPGFLEQHGKSLRGNMRLFLGGEDAFCARTTRLPNGSFADFGALDRRELAAAGLRPILSEDPLIIDGHAFTTGIVPRTSIERVLPNTFVSFGETGGSGCNVAKYAEHHFTEAELSGGPQPDQHLHEHGTCFHVRDRGLVVITSCGHGGIINTVNRAKQVTGIDKVYALVGGFHLGPAPMDYLTQIMGELKKLDIEHIFPMHCTGQNFIDIAKREIPQSLVLCTTGTQFTFAA
jgi:7,8-dihydropterin-6-yl-methyl-4-(beta-D-ribofuranosyl)aminobenzene 5'-phosphate synthase